MEIYVIHACGKLLFTLRPKLKEVLNELENTGVVAKVDYGTGWVNTLFIVDKKDGSLMFCWDPHLNVAIERQICLDNSSSHLCVFRRDKFLRMPLAPDVLK